MSNQIELSQEELDIIQARRDKEKAEQAEKEAQEALERKQREEKRLKLIAEHQVLVDKLKDIDKDNILTVEYDNQGFPYLTFETVDDIHKVEIDEHIVRGTSSYTFRGTSKGLKYKIYGSINDWKRQYLTKPETVLSKVKQYIEDVKTKHEDEIQAERLEKLALAKAKELYSNHDVKSTIAITFGNHIVPIISVTTEKGSVGFRYHEVDGEIEFECYKYEPSSQLKQQIVDLILK